MFDDNYSIYDDSVLSSPKLDTPFLEASSSMDTPFIDYPTADTPPFFDISTDFSPYSVYDSLKRIKPVDPKDVFVGCYLENNSTIAKLTHDPLKFNGDPSLLLIDKSKALRPVAESKPSPPVKLFKTVTEESDSLFPPLNSSQQSLNTQEETQEKQEQDMDLDDILGFDSSSPLSESLDFEDSNDDEEEAEEAEEDEEDEEYVLPVEKPVSRKRKATAAPTASETPSVHKPVKKARVNKIKTKEPKQYKCPHCDHVSTRRYNLSTHIKTHDKNRVKEFECSECHKCFDRRHDRDRHITTVHEGKRSFKCQHCNIRFSRRDGVNRHLVQKHDYDEADLVD